MKPFFILTLAALGGLLTDAATAAPEPANLALRAKATASSVMSARYGPQNAVDGIVSNDSRWIGKAGAPQILTVDLGVPREIGCIQLIMGWDNQGQWNSWTTSFVIQYWVEGSWRDVPGTDVKDNGKVTCEFRLAQPIRAARLRVVARNEKAMRLVELRIYAPSAAGYPTLPKLKQAADIEGGDNFTFTPVKTVLANQGGYNLDWPKRFTAPLAEGEKEFTIAAKDAPGEVLYRGMVKDGVGDFSGFRPQGEGREYVIAVQDGKSTDTASDPFAIAPYWLERACLEPALRFMIDARSYTGTHPSGYGGGPWRDSTYYTYELPSLVMLYLANPDVYDQAPVEIDWQADKARLLAPNYPYVKANGDQGGLEAARRYYREMDPPVGGMVPDVIQLIHWGTGYDTIKPVSTDPTEGVTKVHPQTIEHLAFFLYGYPSYKQYFTEKFYRRVSEAAFGQWEKTGLLGVFTTFGDFKGRECPGHSVLPNLMMHEVAKREGRPDAGRYLQAAAAQARWIVEKLDLRDPVVTKGQRMSEHMLITGLVTLLRDYPDAAPAGLRDKLKEWAAIVIERSANMWDFRRYDGQYWALPKTAPNSRQTATWNEPGNITAFPALCFAVAAQLNDPAMGARLEQIAAAHWDDWWGRNPIGAHADFNGPKDYPGVERGWPKPFLNDTCARLTTARGTINATASTEQYPFNPAGEFRHCEGWTAFNSSLNVGLSYSVMRDTAFDLFDGDFAKAIERVAPGAKLGLQVQGPLVHPAAKAKQVTLTVTTTSGDLEKVMAEERAPGSFTFRALLPTAAGEPKPGDGTLQLKAGGKVTVVHGIGYFRSEKQWPVAE